ncbi:Uu.00g029690.m01.CDS01 [Anthostomella pinea]|uniref:Uu.00g029690.m01.CDS01 n=1 Tax=Anthostomella pinea TaxID=933095 RepID=A0AAI8YCU1_9PEZI|nr:Uu.00g029690.m01.CDS01 [Anthostomella pinea]
MDSIMLLVISLFANMAFGAPIMESQADADDSTDSASEGANAEPVGGPVPGAGTILDTGAIIGIIAGVIATLLLVGLLYWCGARGRYPGVQRRR